MTIHTPGPWFFDENDKVNPLRAYGINRKLSAQVAAEMGVELATETIAEVCDGSPCALADARLIAAAPDLLAAAIRILSLNRTQGVEDEDYRMAEEDLEAAIERATNGKEGSDACDEEAKLARKHVAIVTVTDPDSKAPVDVEIRKLESGGMVGIDASYLEQEVGSVWSPYDRGVEIIVPDDENTPNGC